MSKNYPNPAHLKPLGSSAAMKRLDKIIEEATQRKEAIASDEMKHVKVRQLLLAYIQKIGADRTDVTWVYNEMPVLRVTRKMREKRLVETTKQKGTPAQLKAWRDNAKKARAALKAKVAAKHKEEVIA